MLAFGEKNTSRDFCRRLLNCFSHPQITDCSTSCRHAVSSHVFVSRSVVCCCLFVLHEIKPEKKFVSRLGARRWFEFFAGEWCCCCCLPLLIEVSELLLRTINRILCDGKVEALVLRRLFGVRLIGWKFNSILYTMGFMLAHVQKTKFLIFKWKSSLLLFCGFLSLLDCQRVDDGRCEQVGDFPLQNENSEILFEFHHRLQSREQL